MSLLRRLQRRPAQTLLVLLAVFFGSAAITLSLSAYLGSPQFKSGLSGRFELSAGWRSRDEWSGHPMFVEADLAPVQALAPDVEKLAIFGRTTNFEPLYIQVEGELYDFPDEATVSADYFDIMEMTPAQGSFFTEADRGQNVVVISEGAARTLFGTDDPIGKTVGVPASPQVLGQEPVGRIPFTVVGTFADADIDTVETAYGYVLFTRPPLLYPAWSQGVGPISDLQETFLAQAKTGQEAAARTQLLAAVRQFYKDELDPQETAEDRDFYLTEPGDGPGLPKDFIDPSVVLFGIFGIVALLTSTIGVFSAQLADVLERGHELGVRRALGASQVRVVLELAGEAASVALVGSALGVLAAALAVPVMNRALGQTDFWQGDLRWQPLAALTALGLVVGLSFVLSLFPTWQAVKTRPIDALKST